MCVAYEVGYNGDPVKLSEAFRFGSKGVRVFLAAFFLSFFALIVF